MTNKLKKLIYVGVVLIMCVGILCACNNDEINIDDLQYTVSNNTSNYYDNVSSKSDLLMIIRSKTQLNSTLNNYNCILSSDYSIEFFENNCLVLCFFTSPIYNEVEINLCVKNSILKIDRNYLSSDGTALDAMRSWTFIVEVNKSQLNNINKIQFS